MSSSVEVIWEKNRTRGRTVLSILFIVALCFTPILSCKSVLPSDVKIVAEPYKWNNDMKRLRITTLEKGLNFKITISNDDVDSIEMRKFTLMLESNVRVEHGVFTNI